MALYILGISPSTQANLASMMSAAATAAAAMTTTAANHNQRNG
jgi:hypothetical protein